MLKRKRRAEVSKSLPYPPIRTGLKTMVFFEQIEYTVDKGMQSVHDVLKSDNNLRDTIC